MDLFWIILAVFFGLYAFLDLNYFIRVIITYVFAKYFRSNVKNPLGSTSVYGICLPSDADFMFIHMNNSRYLREYDFARFDLLTRTGILDFIIKRGGSFPVSALSIRYRQPLYIFSPYKVVSTPVWWDAKFLYLDQRLVTLSDNVIRSIAYVKLAIVKVDFEKLIEEYYPGTTKPTIPSDLLTWIQANDLSSEKLKQELQNIKKTE